jgi:hypothetical protein
MLLAGIALRDAGGGDVDLRVLTMVAPPATAANAPAGTASNTASPSAKLPAAAVATASDLQRVRAEALALAADASSQAGILAAGRLSLPQYSYWCLSASPEE